MTAEMQGIMAVIARIIDLRGTEKRISPSWVATEVMLHFDPKKTTEPNIYIMGHLQARQLARMHLRGRFEGDSNEPADQHELFPELQKRYPAAVSTRDDGEPEYVLLEEMADADYDFNIARLRKEANAKLRHADALEAHKYRRKAAA